MKSIKRPFPNGGTETIQCSLTDLERESIWVVRTLVAIDINKVPEEKKEKAKKFKEYEPGYLHPEISQLFLL
ncbi:MAG: hypothetical protein L3J59_02425 [Methylococcaceae bacterium]|nr:hypothetical protein [Methylococcaceae bacterium]